MVGRELFVSEDELKFKQAFVINFISSWAATEYEASSQRVQCGRLSAPPIVNAQVLANKAWSQLVEDIDSRV